MPRSPVIAGNAPAFGSSEFRLTAKHALSSVGWPLDGRKRQLRRGGWLWAQSAANLSLRISLLNRENTGNFHENGRIRADDRW